MYPLKLDKGQAASRYGKEFVRAMMKTQDVIYIDETQDEKALLAKAIREGHVRPFFLDWVYVVSNGGSFIKVGRSNWPKSRFTSLQTGTPHPLKLEAAGAFRGYSAAGPEKEIHRQLTKAGIDRRNEWFECSPATAKAALRKVCASYRGTMNLSKEYDFSVSIFPYFRATHIKEHPRLVDDAERKRGEIEWVMKALDAA